MPQMGESIAEGTVSKWLKQLGDPVERDELILEISTDKVDAEIPAPESGTLVEVRIQEGETVEIGTVLAYIDTEADAPVADADDAIGAPDGLEPGAGPSDASAEPLGTEARSSDGHAAQAADQGSVQATAEVQVQTRSTPVVRKIAAEHGISIADVPGTGQAGRVTKQDILLFIENGLVKAPAASDHAAPHSGQT